MSNGLAYVEGLVKHHENFPIKGILFHDIFPVLRDPLGFEILMNEMFSAITANVKDKVDIVVGLDARGFLFGPVLASRLGASFVPIRKKGKLPGECISIESVKEYGKDVLEIQSDSIKEGQTVVIVDDLLATGGTLSASVQLVNKAGGKVALCICAIGLPELKGEEKVDAKCVTLLDMADGCE
eukprot:m.134672 g.134672  ORF g.134672 m.134672 type:complete len:183 (+) comp9670_c0_seq1:74-622(+)